MLEGLSNEKPVSKLEVVDNVLVEFIRDFRDVEEVITEQLLFVGDNLILRCPSYELYTSYKNGTFVN